MAEFDTTKARGATKRMIFSKKIKVGNYEKNPVFLEARIEEIDLSTQDVFRYVNGKAELLYTGSVKETTTHETVSKYKTISICGYSRNFFGQIREELLTDEFKPSINRDRLIRIIEIWGEWHLNELKPNCVHQEKIDDNLDYDKRRELETMKCPRKYEYGSKCLLEIVPDHIIEELISLFTEQ